MGINVKVQKSPKPKDVIKAQVKLERDLKSCMQCRFFYGNNSQCLAKKCVKEEKKPELTEQDKKHKCYGCTYMQSEKYCFPCMKELFGYSSKERQEESVFEEEEKKNGQTYRSNRC